MSELGSSSLPPRSPGTEPVTRIDRAQGSPDQQAPQHQGGQPGSTANTTAAADSAAQNHHDPAVSLAASFARLDRGALLAGLLAGLSPEGEPVLESPSGTYVISGAGAAPKALATARAVVLEIVATERVIEARVVSIDGTRPPGDSLVRLALIKPPAGPPQPAVATEGPPVTGLPSSYRPATTTVPQASGGSAPPDDPLPLLTRPPQISAPISAPVSAPISASSPSSPLTGPGLLAPRVAATPPLLADSSPPAPAQRMTGSTPAAAGPLPQPHENWPSLAAALAVLAASDATLAAGLLAKLPTPEHLLTPVTLLFLTLIGVRNPARLLFGRDALDRLAAAGRGDLLARIDRDVEHLRLLASGHRPDPAFDGRSGEWRQILLPLRTEDGLQAIPLLLRTTTAEARDEAGEDARKQADGSEDDRITRFLLDLRLKATGCLQFDGLIRGRAVTLILRSERAVAPAPAAHIRGLFESALAGGGYAGELLLKTAAPLPLPPLAQAPSTASQGPIIS